MGHPVGESCEEEIELEDKDGSAISLRDGVFDDLWRDL